MAYKSEYIFSKVNYSFNDIKMSSNWLEPLNNILTGEHCTEGRTTGTEALTVITGILDQQYSIQ